MECHGCPLAYLFQCLIGTSQTHEWHVELGQLCNACLRRQTTPVSSVTLPKACIDPFSRCVSEVVVEDFEQRSTWDALPADSRVQTTAEFPQSRAGSLWGAVCEARGDSAGPDHRAAGVWAGSPRSPSVGPRQARHQRTARHETARQAADENSRG